MILDKAAGRRLVVISDSNVWQAHGSRLLSVLSAASGVTPPVYIATPGEASKCRVVKAHIEDWMLSSGCLRDTCVVSFGGGVVTDLAGFVAGTFMRGVPFINIPTSLLAMVDASVGGKTGIDTPAGKNLVGLFHQPRAVFADLSLLATLPRREFRAGLAEVVKVGAVFDVRLFEVLEQKAEVLLAGSDDAALQSVIAQSVRVKSEVVSADTRDAGLRKVLNFGHTIGHALETLLAPDLLHGEAVAIGMVKEAEVARALGVCHAAPVERLRRLLWRLGLPTAVPEHVDVDACVALMAMDKKNTGGGGAPAGTTSDAGAAPATQPAPRIHCVLLADIGSPVGAPVSRAVDVALLRRVLCRGVAVDPVPRAVSTPKPRATPTPLSPSSVEEDDDSDDVTKAFVPGSKSLTNRMMLLAALAGGTTALKGALPAADTMSMARCLQQFGAACRWTSNDGGSLVVRGSSRLQVPKDGEPINVHDSGTAGRFLLALCALLPPSSGFVTITGSKRMQERPMGDLVDALRSQGVTVRYLRKEGCLPVSVRGNRLPGGRVAIKSSVSSQFVSALLMAAPYAAAPMEIVLNQIKPTSLPFISMTLRCMAQFGVHVQQLAPNHYRVPQARYRGAKFVHVEPDATSASYAMAMAAVTGTRVQVPGIGTKSVQGDAAFASLLERMGCSVQQTELGTTVAGPSRQEGLVGAGTVDMNAVTDCFMSLAAVAAVARGSTRIVGIANQRVKECNRIEAMVKELTKCGVHAVELEDGIEVTGLGSVTAPTQPKHQQQVVIHCYNDHRIAMSFAVLGACDHPRLPRIILEDASCTAKT